MLFKMPLTVFTEDFAKDDFIFLVRSTLYPLGHRHHRWSKNRRYRCPVLRTLLEFDVKLQGIRGK